MSVIFASAFELAQSPMNGTKKLMLLETMRCRQVFFIILWISLGILIGRWLPNSTFDLRVPEFHIKSPIEMDVSVEKNVSVDRLPFLFIGGHESSGTGLMRIQMDAHSWIRCGAEPMITQEVLHLWKRYGNPPSKRVLAAGIYPDALNEATKAYIRETIERMGPPAKLLCHKQPMIFAYLKQLGQFFPDAKFIHMVRDGRGAVTSSIRRSLLSNKTHNKHLLSWETIVTKFMTDCAELGPKRCINVRYESLILKTEEELRKVLNFINVPWEPIVLKHESILNKLTSLNKFEPSTSQFKKPVHNDSLLTWSKPGALIPVDVLEKSCENITLLRTLNYCPPEGYIPDYSTIPSEIFLE